MQNLEISCAVGRIYIYMSLGVKGLSGDLDPFLAVNQLGHEVDHWPPSNAKVKNKWGYTSATAVCLYDVYRET